MGGKRISSGDVFGKLKAIEITHKKTGKSGRIRSFWICKCECGEIHEVDSGNLRNGNTHACPRCAAIERSRGRVKPYRKHRVYAVYMSMVSRCHNENSTSYRRYGSRGITVCDRWRESFDNFIEDMGIPADGMEIDRIDYLSGYSKENCRWVDNIEQANNKENVILYEYNGEKLSLAQWSRKLGIDYDRLKARIRRYGISFEDAIKEKLKSKYKYITPDGEFYSLSELAKFYGMSTSGVNGRIENELFTDWYKEENR